MVWISNITEPEDGSIVYKSDDIELKIGEVNLGKGTLYITEEHLAWKPIDKTEGIKIIWKRISLHGISNAPQKSIYIMLDHLLIWPNVYDPGANGNNRMGGDDNDDSENDEGHESDCGEEFTELWLIPSDVTAIDSIFQAMKECQSLHPDSADSVSDESDFLDAVGDHNTDDDNEEFGPDENNLRNNIGDGDGMRNLNLNEDRFADAQE